MGCQCYETKGNDANTNNDHSTKNKVIVNQALLKSKPQKKNNTVKNTVTKTANKAEKIDKCSSISSLSSINSKITPDLNLKTLKKFSPEKIQKNLPIPSFDSIKLEKTNIDEKSDNNNININEDNKNKKDSNLENEKEKIPKKIICNIVNKKKSKDHNEIISKQIQDDLTIKELKQLILDEKNTKNKCLNLYFEGFITNDDDILNKLNDKSPENKLIKNINNKQKKNNDNIEMNLDMISVTVDEEQIPSEVNDTHSNKSNSSINNSIIEKKKEKEKDILEKMMNKISPLCQKHFEEHLIYVCINCQNSFCALDYEEHMKKYKDHKVIHKKKLIDLNYDIKNIKQTLGNSYKEISNELNNDFYKNNQLCYIPSSDIYNKLKLTINTINEKMENLFDTYKRAYFRISSRFLSVYDENFPKIIEFDEFIEKNLHNFNNVDIFVNESNFIENYNSCNHIKNNNIKYMENLFAIKDYLRRYKLFLEIVKDNGEKLIEYLKREFKKILDYDDGDQYYDIVKEAFKSNNPNYSFTTRSINRESSRGKINLKFLLNDKRLKNSVSDNISSFNTINSKNLAFNRLYKSHNELISNNDANDINRICDINTTNQVNNTKNKNLESGEKDISNNLNSDIKKDNNNELNNMEKNELNETNKNESEIQNNNIKNDNNIKNISIEFKKNDTNSNIKLNVQKDTVSIKEDNKNISSSNIPINSGQLQSKNNILQNDLSKISKKEIVQNPTSPKNSSNCIYSLEYGTSHIVSFDYEKYAAGEKKLELINVDVSNLRFKKFEKYICDLNYNKSFYISGGYSTSKDFYEFDSSINKFYKLPNMLFKHYYHCMIGYQNYIFAISGYKSKKVEKYSLNNKKWVEVPDLTCERSFSNALIFNEKLYIFGNSEKNKEVCNCVEFLEISNGDKVGTEWKIIELKENFPIYSGMAFISESEILLVGGKLEINGNVIKNSFIMEIKDNEVNIKNNELMINNKDEFGGKIFYDIDKDKKNCGLFSAINPYLIYIYNYENKNFDCILYSKE